MEIVSVLRIALADRVGKERFDLWFGPSVKLRVHEDSLMVSVPNRFLHDWIRSSFRCHLEAVGQQVLGKTPDVRFEIDPSLNASQTIAPHDPTTISPPSSAAAVSVSQTSVPSTRDPSLDQPPGQSGEAPAAAGANSQSLSAAPRRVFAHLESYVVGQSNRLGFASAEMAARRPGQITPLLIYGPTGVGKTHLLQGIWTAARRHRTARAVYLSAEQFTSYFVEALRGSGLPNFRRKYRGVDLLLLDDLQFLAGKRATQVELLHTVDELLREGRQLVFTADRAPAELTDLAAELTTRLQGGMICHLESPDYATRLGIVAQFVSRFEMNVPRDVQEFIAASLTNHARELSGALCRLQATSQATGRPIDLEMARKCLAELIHYSSPVVRLPDIEKAICDLFGVDSGRLQSDCKAKSVSHPRMLAMWLARKHTRAALSEIGDFFGHRSHSTVISAQKRIDGWRAAGKPIALANQDWKLDEAIRQVESRLRAC